MFKFFLQLEALKNPQLFLSFLSLLDRVLLVTLFLSVAGIKNSIFKDNFIFYMRLFFIILLGIIRILIIKKELLHRQSGTQDSSQAFIVTLKTGIRVRILLVTLIGLHSLLILKNSSLLEGCILWLLLVLDFGILLRFHIEKFSMKTLLRSIQTALLWAIWVLPFFGMLIVALQKIYRLDPEKDSPISLTGLSFELHPGSIEDLVLRSSIAYRVKTEPSLARGFEKYWRSATLTQSDGMNWTRPELLSPSTRTNQRELDSRCLVRQWVYPNQEETEKLPIGMDPPLDLSLNAIDLQQTPWRVTSDICHSARPSDSLSTRERNRFLQLGKPVSNQIQHLIRDWKRNTSSTSGLIQEGLLFFKSNSFRYTHHPKRLNFKPELDQFLFKTREGFCEHYAAAFATLMRAAGLPARVVVGFYESSYNPYGDFWSISFKNAHAWTEVWDKTAWIRIDPIREIGWSDSNSKQNNSRWTKLSEFSDAVLFKLQKFYLSQSGFWIRFIFSTLFLILITKKILFKLTKKSRHFDQWRIEFQKFYKTLHKHILLRKDNEGYESYRNNLYIYLDKKKDETELKIAVHHFFMLYEESKYGSNNINNTYWNKQTKQIRKVKVEIKKIKDLKHH